MQYFDFHTHRLESRQDVTAVVDVGLQEAWRGLPRVSVGLHPWKVTEQWSVDVEAVRRLAQRAEVRCIGECGLDRTCANWPWQRPAFEAQLQLAAELDKPVVVHCVRAADELLAVRRQFQRVEMVVHGFRGKPQLAAQLLERGIGLSFGPRFNAESLRLAFEDGRMWLETDDGDVPIEQVYERASRALSISPTDIVVPGTFWS